MRKILVIGLLVFSFQAFALEQTAVQQLSRQLTSFSTYRANFKQITTTEEGRALQTSSGKVFIKRPGMFRWESNTPTQQIMIAVGETLWIYDVDLQQATKQALSRSRARIDPAMLLSGSVKNLDSLFNVSAKASTFRLTPKKSDYGFKRVNLVFESNQLVSMVVLNNLDQTTTFTFSNIQLNKKLPNSLFQFTPPKGVDVISQ